MKYQLVLQFRGDMLDEYDAMIVLEDKLIETLGHSAKVDGHDMGSGERNIFILTSDAPATFWQIKQVLTEDQLKELTAAYRSMSGELFTVIWPENSTEKFSIA